MNNILNIIGCMLSIGMIIASAGRHGAKEQVNNEAVVGIFLVWIFIEFIKAISSL